MAVAKQKKELYALAALVLVAVVVWYFEFAKQPTATGFSMDNSTYTPINAQDFGGVLAGLDRAQATEYKSTGRNIFVMGALPTPASADTKAAAVKPVQPDFEDVQLRVFDLGNVNEPELVLTAKARMPQPSREKQGASPGLQYMITLVAREDVNGEFHKALANVTDAQHLDVIPQLELIDAVDVDGDGRGELLFRQVSDAGSAFVVYRVIGDRLYALFQGTLG